MRADFLNRLYSFSLDDECGHLPRVVHLDLLPPRVSGEDLLVVKVPGEHWLRLGVHDPLEEDPRALLHRVPLDLGHEPRGARGLGADLERLLWG